MARRRSIGASECGRSWAATSRVLIFVALGVALASCTKSVARLDASTSVDAGDASVDAGTDAGLGFDAAGLACYPVSFDYILQSSNGFTLYVGRFLSCDDFGFVATSAELSAAQGFGATCTLHATDEYWCALPVSNSWVVAGSDYDDICTIESTLGPRRWICVYIE